MGRSSSSFCPPSSVVVLCAFLSFFMGIIHIATNPATEHIDSPEKVELLKVETVKNIKDLGPSVSKMLNLTSDDGEPVVASFQDLFWVRKLHMGHLSVLPWLIIAPLQVSSKVRGSFPRLHRTLGYVFFTSSAALCTGLTLLVATGRVHGYPHWLSLLINICKLCYFATSLIMSLRFARARKLRLHQRWITRHLAMGYTVSFQRILLFIVGPLLHANNLFVQEPTIRDMKIWYNATTLVSTVPPILVVEALLWWSRGTNVEVNKNKKQL